MLALAVMPVVFVLRRRNKPRDGFSVTATERLSLWICLIRSESAISDVVLLETEGSGTR